MRLKVSPGDFRVFEELEFESDPRGPFHVHRVIKEKMTTSEALDRIARAASVPRTAIAYAGLKDRQAITQQYISIEGETVDIREPDLKVRFVGKSATKIDSKQSSGNRFQIVVRDVSLFDVARLRRNRAAVEAAGLPNYFDDQRFGNLAQGQGFVFEALAKGDPELALRWLIAAPPEDDRGGDTKLRRLLDHNWRDWETCRNIARGPMYERLFGVLMERPGDFVAALDVIPTRLKLIHLFAYQSFLWNVAVARWVREHDSGRDRLDVPSLCGPLTCWKYPNAELAAALRSKSFPLIDHATTYEDQDFGAIMTEVLARRGLRQSDLRTRDISGMRLQEEMRPLALQPQGLEILGPTPDEEFQGRLKMELRFSLPRGAYATLVVKRLFADPARRQASDGTRERARPGQRGNDLNRGWNRQPRDFARGGSDSGGRSERPRRNDDRERPAQRDWRERQGSPYGREERGDRGRPGQRARQHPGNLGQRAQRPWQRRDQGRDQGRDGRRDQLRDQRPWQRRDERGDSYRRDERGGDHRRRDDLPRGKRPYARDDRATPGPRREDEPKRTPGKKPAQPPRPRDVAPEQRGAASEAPRAVPPPQSPVDRPSDTPRGSDADKSGTAGTAPARPNPQQGQQGQQGQAGKGSALPVRPGRRRSVIRRLFDGGGDASGTGPATEGGET